MRTPGEAAVYRIFYPSMGGALRRLEKLFAFLIGGPWLVRWWGLQYVRMFVHFVIRDLGFELPYRQILLASAPKGILHVGASVGQEAALYAELRIPFAFWIEAQEECRPALQANLAKCGRRRDRVAIAAVSSSSGEEVLLHRVENSISTSLKPMGEGHKRFLPFLHQITPTTTTTITLDDLLAREGLLPDQFDFLYLDVQGSELDVLRGAKRSLAAVQHVMTEVSSREHYEGGARESELHSALVDAGFRLVERLMLPIGHGNALYSRAPTTLLPVYRDR
jgi:FkbM family methyltransferase